MGVEEVVVAGYSRRHRRRHIPRLPRQHHRSPRHRHRRKNTLSRTLSIHIEELYRWCTDIPVWGRNLYIDTSRCTWLSIPSTPLHNNHNSPKTLARSRDLHPATTFLWNG